MCYAAVGPNRGSSRKSDLALRTQSAHPRPKQVLDWNLFGA